MLLQSARPLNAIRLAIVGAMVVAFLGVLFIPWFSHFFSLSLPAEPYSVVAVVVGIAVGIYGRVTATKAIG